MSFFGDIFGNSGNPYNKAMGYYNQIPGEEEKYLDPYINEGIGDMGTLHSQYMNLLNNPDALMQHLGQGYQQSPGYQFQVDQATKAANRAAAAGGMAGSGAEQQSLADTVNGLANQDYNQYLNHAMGLYGQGLGGLSHMNDMGYSASQGLSGDLASNLMNEGNLSAESQQYKNQNEAGLLNGILHAVSNFSGGLMGSSGGMGGGMMGGAPDSGGGMLGEMGGMAGSLFGGPGGLSGQGQGGPLSELQSLMGSSGGSGGSGGGSGMSSIMSLLPMIMAMM